MGGNQKKKNKCVGRGSHKNKICAGGWGGSPKNMQGVGKGAVVGDFFLFVIDPQSAPQIITCKVSLAKD